MMPKIFHTLMKNENFILCFISFHHKIANGYLKVGPENRSFEIFSPYFTSFKFEKRSEGGKISKFIKLEFQNRFLKKKFKISFKVDHFTMKFSFEFRN